MYTNSVIKPFGAKDICLTNQQNSEVPYDKYTHWQTPCQSRISSICQFVVDVTKIEEVLLTWSSQLSNLVTVEDLELIKWHKRDGATSGRNERWKQTVL